MSGLITVPLKRGSELDLIGPFTTWLNLSYNSVMGSVRDDLTSSLSELNRMRQAIVKLKDRNEVGLLLTANYYDQISALEDKIGSKGPQILFKWKDAFQGGRKSALSKGKTSLASSSFTYEKFCVLFNIGALNSWVAANQDFYNNESLHKALKCLQASAGIFRYLKDNIGIVIEKNYTLDIKPDTLDILAELMISQAQEMVIAKAMKDDMKDGVMAKLCSQCDAMFSNLKEEMTSSSNNNVFSSSWSISITQKQKFYQGISQYFQSKICHERVEDIGEEICRLQYAKKLLKNVSNEDLTYQCDLKEWKNKIENALASATNDNNCIYSEIIPEVKDLVSIEKVTIAKPLAVSTPLGNPDAPSLFAMLVPMVVVKSLSAFKDQLEKRKADELDTLNKANQSLNHILSSLNLPASLEDVSGVKLPESLQKKAESIIHEGGLDLLMNSLEKLPELMNKNISSLDQCQCLIMDQQEKESQLKSRFNENWNRSSFGQINEHIVAVDRYQKLVKKASMADNQVKDKIEIHQVFLEMLSKGTEYLEKAIPSVEGADLPKTSAELLRGQMKEVEVIKSERIVLASEVNGINPDVRPILMNIYSKEGVINEEEITKKALDKEFDLLQTNIQVNIANQNDLMSRIETSHAAIFEDNTAHGSTAREETFKQLAAAYDAFFEIKWHLEKGENFYRELSESITAFQSSLEDFCVALDIEKDDLVDDMGPPVFHDAKS